ncbi:MAG: 1-acyl-sn-glycerol-3-phosphate acyltransferase [Myxococcales bacterium]|nr:1-acyl-sn-glycerol-3-phosphate acyltransferase [Myxococcales bacterium]
MTSLTAKSWDRTLRALRAYHSYEVIGLETFPRHGAVLVASTHSLATYENFLLGSMALDVLGRRPYILADDLIFKVPVVGTALREVGVVPGKRDAALEILGRGDLLGLGPGGMREALRSSRRKYEFDWDGRMGFVWVAMTAGVPIVLAACPSADDIYTVADLPVTSWMYDRYHLPLPLFRGLGPTLVPRPVKLRHVLGEPILSDVPPDRVTEDHVRAHHAYVCERMRALMQHARALSGLA